MKANGSQEPVHAIALGGYGMPQDLLKSKEAGFY